MINVLTDNLFTIKHNNRIQEVSLAKLLELIGLGEDFAFMRLRKHQEPGFNVFLTHLATHAAHIAGSKKPLTEEKKIIKALQELVHNTPSFWNLFGDEKEASFMQAPLKGTEKRTGVDFITPDQLDILISSKNHDVKEKSILFARPEDWVYSIINRVTTAGYLGSGNFGVVRINGGFGARNYSTIMVDDNLGLSLYREVLVLLKNRSKIAAQFGYKEQGGITLVSTVAWDGETMLAMNTLDPYFVECARSIRLYEKDGVIRGYQFNSKNERLAGKLLLGNTGDPWTPLQVKKGEITAMSVNKSGLSYKKIVAMMLPDGGGSASLLQSDFEELPGEHTYELVTKMVAKGQGTVEGYFESRIPVNPKMRSLFTKKRSFLAQVAKDRVTLLGVFNKAIYSAVIEIIDNPDKASAIFLTQFDSIVNQRFFADLFLEAQAEGDIEEMSKIREAWIAEIVQIGHDLIEQASATMSRSRHSKYERLVNAKGRYIGMLYKHKVLVRKPTTSQPEEATQ